MSSLRRALFVLALVGGCAEPLATPSTHVEPTAARAPVATRIAPLRIEVNAPRSVRFGSTALGLDDALVELVVTNEADTPVLVGELLVAFEVQREGVAFPCERQAPDHDFDARRLRAGESFRAHAPLHCWTPLTGAYDARAIVQLARGAGSAVVPFRFEVTDGLRAASQPYPARPGLYVLAGGALQTLPIPDAVPDDHGYRAVLVLANASARPMALPPVRVTLDVFRERESLPCTSQVSLHPFATLAPGAVHVERVPVTCLRERRGTYEIRASVAFEDEAAVEAGRFQVRVTDDLGVVLSLP